ncbi:HNH endonuclease signature motif containing protein [Sphingobacterium sp.]|uniref:HNH endonuclease signature motif containing protein n=1 Tax=Sphingobacterium sp. TaxID=341027 RepID=UPI0028AAEC33|nr:HNH endonuclease signature motif containing protein [Sphingobacterium sp.]
MAKFHFTKEIEAFIRSNYLKMSRSEIGAAIGTGEGVVGRYLKSNSLAVPREVSIYFRTRKNHKPFTEEEDRFIHENIQDRSIKWISKELHRTSAYVSKRAKELGYQELIDRKALDSRIKKGSTPPNKGKKQTEYMSSESIKKTEGTRFKKGDMPHNCYHEVGKIVVRERPKETYKFICVEIGKWRMLHVANWEKLHGPVPKGYCLWCKDGDTLNCDPSNWELISRKENLRRNNLSDSAVASKLARIKAGKQGNFIDPEAKLEYLKHPILIQLKRDQLILNAQINDSRKNKRS